MSVFNTTRQHPPRCRRILVSRSMSFRGASLFLVIGLLWPLAGPVTAQTTQGNQSPAVNARGNVAINYNTLTEAEILQIAAKLDQRSRAGGAAPTGGLARLRLVQVVPRLP